MGSDLASRIRNVTAVLGPTNTGKTHLAIERMLGHQSGMIGLPLRLLAREVYDKIVARVGADKVALVTGEEKIKPERARYWVSTVEAMPRDIDVDFLAIDEVQLAADPERGHVFTDRLLNARGQSETLLLGAQTMRDAIADLIPGANFISRPRLSTLTYAGQKKITRLPARAVIVAFSAQEVYAIAELIRRQSGGTAVVLGALSPRTRNAQVALYQSGDVEYLVATDAIGMGLNLDVDHVAFSAKRKFDGQNHRELTPAEIGQIAGRAGRHMNDGSFGVTGACDPFDPDLIERLENHTFDSVRVLQWRNRTLEFQTLDRLMESLREAPRHARLTRARMADDMEALEAVARDPEIRRLTQSPAAVAKLWDVCQLPDYRKISNQSHAELVSTLYTSLRTGEERVPEDWFSKQVSLADRTDGDIDTLSTRLAHIRTWTFVSNRADWLKDPEHWQGKTREIEDKLSDALHECLTQRFVDKRTSALMKGMRDKDELSAVIGEDGAVHVESHFVGRLKGFRFTPETQSDNVHGKAARLAAAQVLQNELAMRARRVAAAQADALKLTRKGLILWREEEIAEVEASDNPLKPSVKVLVDEHISASDRDKVQAKLDTWLSETVAEKLKPLADIQKAEDVAGLARGIAFRLVENFGVLKRETIANEIKTLDQTARSQLRKYGVRFGAFNIYFPLLLKPAAADLALTLWTLKHAVEHGLVVDAMPESPRAGLTSVVADAKLPEAFYRASGYHMCGPRAVRLDILERIADLIRPLLAYRADPNNPTMPPKGATGDGGFVATPEMMSILGCSPDELGNVLKALGFKLERRPVKAPAAAGVPAEAAPAETAPAIAETDAATGIALKNGTPENLASENAAAVVEAPAMTADAGAAVESAPEGSVTAAPVAVEEQKFEDIWRPRRHGRGDRGQERSERPRHRRGGDRGPGPRHDRPQQAPQGVAPAALAGEVAAAQGGSPAGASNDASPIVPLGERPEQNRRDHDRHGKPRDNRRPDGGRDDRKERREPDAQAGRAGREGDRAGRPDRGRPDRDKDRDRSNRDAGRREGFRPPQVISASPPKKTGVDSDSPFAALGALKDALEKRGKDA